MSEQSLKPGWKMVKFGDMVKNANLVEREPEPMARKDVGRVEHIDPENLHIRRWGHPFRMALPKPASSNRAM
jgi:type I restriction enzyme S subunit